MTLAKLLNPVAGDRFYGPIFSANANLRRRGRHPLPCHLVLLSDGVIAAHRRLQQGARAPTDSARR